MRLDEIKAAVITGGASGLGEATARMLAAGGVKVALFDLDQAKGEALAAEIGGLFCAVDVTDEASMVAGFAAARAAHGSERLLVACAGIAPGAKTTAKGAPHPMGLFEKAIAINLTGAFRAMAHASTGMAALDPVGENAERGVMIATASVAAFDGQIGQAAYSASKAGLVGLTLPVARDLAPLGIRVMTIAPGLFETPMLKGLPQEVQDSLGRQTPFPSRLGRPSEYAAMVRSIIENPMLNGETIRLDGAIRLAPR
ncbi:SDR family NAD(P)-dependent oxidoreductase [Prosthecodimorpha staleyi]|uniref:SDR family NAD(P)-dependent oxidoreductase n=1 Tax=Prosthecodimorpha staleyi TaxID=2840188 RepID=A0A947D1R7_9HYPH|nr:SDR family NAD(P)-dependent oxidoreductase [Prosthecodimorpha staleyi]MBT9289081.1 SDR family NAD(P)-dependent oxidoreductase [Prosthecodimorpha staleyi]